MISTEKENFMNHEKLNSRKMDLHRRIALILRKEPTLVRNFAERLHSKLAVARSSAAVSDTEWEWYIILTLWSPLQVIELLEDSSEQAARLRRNSPFVSLLSLPEQRGTAARSRSTTTTGTNFGMTLNGHRNPC
jgi:hypothetical protein